jgi:hypothetical protein
VAEVIHEWNHVNSRDRSIVLLPLRWETHTSPEMGAPPQTIINRQVVDQCDMTVGVFWTRLGTPTTDAESGTAEEIARVGEAGKPVMLYFSRALVDLDSVDLEEYGRLRDFKKRSYPNGLIENYISLIDFRDKFRRQLAIRIRDIIAEDTLQGRNDAVTQDIALGLAKGSPPKLLAQPSVVRLERLICIDQDDIPDYDGAEAPTPKGVRTNLVILNAASSFSDYYRKLVKFICESSVRCELRPALSTLSDRSVHDIHLEIRVRTITGSVDINPPTMREPGQIGIYYEQDSPPGDFSVGNVSAGEWRMETDVPVVQARRTVFSVNGFTLKAIENSALTFDATVYSSNALPFSLNTELKVVVETQERSYRDILKLAIPDYK